MLLNDLYLLGKSKGYDTVTMPVEFQVQHRIHIMQTGKFKIETLPGKGEKIKLVGTTNRPSSKRRDNPRVNDLWDSFGWFDSRNEFALEYEEVFWDQAESALRSSGDNKLAEIVAKTRRLCSITLRSRTLVEAITLYQSKNLATDKICSLLVESGMREQDSYRLIKQLERGMSEQDLNKYLQNKNLETKKKNKNLETKKIGNFVLMYNGRVLQHLPNVVSWMDKMAQPDEGSQRCLLSGCLCTPIDRQPDILIDHFKYNKAPAMSFNQVRSEYGRLKGNSNFPVSIRAANAYSRMLAELGKDAIPLPVWKGLTFNKVAVLVWSSEDSPNADKIRSILNCSKPPDWNFCAATGNIHFLAMSMEQQRRSVLAYDVVPEKKVVSTLKKLKKELCQRSETDFLFGNCGIKQSVHMIEELPYDKRDAQAERRIKIGHIITPVMLVQLYRSILFGLPCSKTIKKSILRLFNQRVLKHKCKGQYEKQYVRWVEFILFIERTIYETK